MFDHFLSAVKAQFNNAKIIALHEPQFDSRDEETVLNCLRSGYVSSIGSYVSELESLASSFTKIPYCVATNSGTSALQLGLLTHGVMEGEIVLTQSLSFAATTNAILYQKATPYYLDVHPHTLSIDPQNLLHFLQKNCQLKEGYTFHSSGKRVAALLLMHTLGIPGYSSEISKILSEWNIPLIEDAAEALGSYHESGSHVGTFASCSVYSLNGNKIITSGGGGFFLCSDEEIANRAKHLSTTAKVPHDYEFVHDQLGYNFRLPNLNAALACSQFDKLPSYLVKKRKLHLSYSRLCSEFGLNLIPFSQGANCWLNAILLKNREERELFLQKSMEFGILARPLWTPSHQLSYVTSLHDDLSQTLDLYNRVVCLPSSAIEIDSV